MSEPFRESLGDSIDVHAESAGEHLGQRDQRPARRRICLQQRPHALKIRLTVFPHDVQLYANQLHGGESYPLMAAETTIPIATITAAATIATAMLCFSPSWKS